MQRALHQRFDLAFVNAEGRDETPLCIHRAPLSTHERMIGFLIEHYAGAFPVWLSPVQVVGIPVAEQYGDYLDEIVADLFDELHADSELRLNKADDAKKPLALQTRTAIAKSLTDSLKTVIGLEREAYSIAQSTLVDNPLASLISQLGAGSAFAIVHDDPDEA